MLGSTIGGYAIVSELGTGGMGTVYLAELKGQRRAIKVVHPHLLATPGYFKRFLREAELGKQIRHENVVRTFDVDAVQVDGEVVHYMVMEHVEGKSLREMLRDLGTIPEPLLREIALQAAQGLDAIHAVAVVHRDLKPENILITEDNEIRIMDLGVAKLQEASIALTREGQFTGSMLYAAPEQFKHEDVGAAADLYALGVMLYELATGQNPFRYPDAAAVIQAHLTEEPRRVHEHNPDLSRFFSEVIATLMAKRPVQRFESAAALRTVLDQGEQSAWWTEHEPIDEAQLPVIRVNRETALHGRAADLAQLHECFALAAAGSGKTVWIEGEAGIGKTRLVDEFVKGVEGAHILYGSYPPSGGMGGFSDAILGQFGEARLAEAVAPYLTETPSLVPAFAALVKRESAPTGAAPIHGDALHAVAAHMMRALAAEKPVVWILDDLHFAPQESRDLALSLARAVEGHAVLLVVTARPGVAQEDFSRLANFSKRTLARLGGRDIVHLLSDAFRSDDLAERLAGKIAVKSDGVPFFVFEMIRGLKEGNFITQQDDGSFHLTQAVDDIEVPSAVKDLIEARMRGLTKDERAVLDVGAVCGMSFDPGLVAKVLEEKRVRVLRDLADIERRHGLVRDDGRAVRFDQNQIQEVLYQSVTPHLRAEYHTLLAEAYDGADPVFLAWHHLHGSRPEQALPHLVPALDRLEKAYRNEAVLDLATGALAIDGLLTGPARIHVLLRKDSRLDMLGRRDEQRAVLDEAIALADETGDPLLRGRAHRSLGVLLTAVSEYDAAQDALRGAAEFGRAAGDGKLEAAATGNLGSIFGRLGRFAEAQECFERASEIGDHETVAAATGNLGLVFRGLGRIEEAQAQFERHITLSRAMGDRQGEATATGNIGLSFHDLGQFAKAEEHYERQRALCREIGDRQGESVATGNIGTVFTARGHHAQAAQYYERHRAVCREIGHRRGELMATGNLGSALVSLGCHAQARRQYEDYLRGGGEIGDRDGEVHALLGLGGIAEAEGDSGDAARLYEDALSRARQVGDGMTVAQTLVTLGRFKADAALLDEGLALAREIGSPDLFLLATTARAQLPDGDVDAAVAAVAEHEDAEHGVRMQARFRLWQMTNERAHLEEAWRLLQQMRDHAPEEDRESMIENVPLHKEIMDAR